MYLPEYIENIPQLTISLLFFQRYPLTCATKDYTETDKLLTLCANAQD